MSDSVSDNLSDSPLSLTDAAAHLGISERTLIRRIEKGSIRGEKIGEGRGGVWRVYLDGQSAAPHVQASDSRQAMPVPLSDSEHSVSDSPTGSAAPNLDRLVDLVDRLQRDNQQLAGQVGFLQAKVQEQERTIALLMAPQDEEPAAEEQPTPALTTQRRPWWRRWIRSE